MSQSFLFTIRLGFPSVIQIPPSQSLTENNIRLFFGKVIPLQNTVNHPVYIKLIPYCLPLICDSNPVSLQKKKKKREKNVIELIHYWFSSGLSIPCNKAILQRDIGTIYVRKKWIIFVFLLFLCFLSWCFQIPDGYQWQVLYS